MRELMTYLPERYENSPEMAAIQQAIEPELTLAWEKRDDLLLQLDPNTATWGLVYWERAFGLPTDEALSLGVRRSRVIARIRGRGTTTPAVLKSVVETFCPWAEVTVTEHFSAYVVEIGLTLTQQAVEDLDGLTAELKLIMPAHLGWGFSYTIETAGAIHFGAASELAGRMDVWPLVVREIETSGAAAWGAGSQRGGRMTVFPLTAKAVETTGEVGTTSVQSYGMTLEIYPIGGNTNG